MARAVHQFVGDAEQSDDLTMLAIKRKNTTQPSLS
jgi:sigma-B regulation protein RsbU (phosphoserine phosphatase)